MAYAAVVSLDETIQRLLDSPDLISISSSGRKKLKNAHKLVMSLKEVVETLDGKSTAETIFTGLTLNRSELNAFNRKMKRLRDARGRSSEALAALDGQIRDALHSFEDALDFHLSDKFLSLSKAGRYKKRDGSRRIISLDLDSDQVWREIKIFAKTVKMLEEDYAREVDRLISLHESDAAKAPHTDFGVEMVGRSNQFIEVKDQVLRKIRPSDFGVFSIVGLLGSGRTAAARASFEYYSSTEAEAGAGTYRDERYFDCAAWVTVGTNYDAKEIIATIIAQIEDAESNPDNDAERLHVHEHLYATLKGRRYLIVLDDIREECVWDELRGSFPEQDNGSAVLLTTGLMEVAISAGSLHIFEMTVYDKRESWGILEEGIFGKESCPLELREAGEKIAKNCGGLRLALAKVVVLLLNAERSADFWNELAADTENPIFVVADELSEICRVENDLKSFPDGARKAKNVITDMIVLPGFKEAIEDELFRETYLPNMGIIVISGMAGVGKTKLARKVYDDLEVSDQFENRVWLTLGPRYKPEKIVNDILSQLSPEIRSINTKIYPILAKRWLIVLDDVWDDNIFDHLLEKPFSDMRGRVLVTTRQTRIIYNYSSMPNLMYLLNEEESWTLFRQKVFANGSCPRELEEAGKKIAENCEGLPLLILTVAVFLSKAERTPEYWNFVAKNKKNSLFLNAYEEISKVLNPSYEYLSQQLKACFLYMGVFPQNYEIPTSKLVKLLSVEGLLQRNPSKKMRKLALHCVQELGTQNLILEREESSSGFTKTYSLHSSFWYLANNIALKSGFSLVLDGRANDDSREYTKNQRRLSIRKSIVLITKKVYNTIKSISSARSFLCFGPTNQYPVPIYLGLRLLRVLDVLTIRFYEFPVEVAELIHLRYVALTCDGSLPSAVSRLCFLQFLIVNRYLNIRSSRNSFYLPMEIWDMKELTHLQVQGSILLDHNSDAQLPSLVTFLDASVYSCTEKILNRMPNLKKLGIQIELAPVKRDDAGEVFHPLNMISYVLPHLKSLKYVIANPEFKLDVAMPSIIPLPIFSSSLKKLRLRGLGYPWNYMSIIGKLKNLKVLKLQNYAFCGAVWDTDNNGFRKLEFLLIEDSDVMYWRVKRSSFPELRFLTMKHCYKLKELPYHLSNSMVLIDVVDCNPLVEKWARQMEVKETKNVIGSRTIGIELQSSWDK